MSRERRAFWTLVCAALAVLALLPVLSAFTTAEAQQQVDMQKLLRGRELVIEHACSGCHGGVNTPGETGWLVGLRDEAPFVEFLIGPCLFEPGAEPCFRTRPRNLTPDNLTGMGRFTERQIFNSLRFGLRPGETADIEITSSTPGQGNFPMNPKYLAPPMPWTAWRHLPDDDLWAIAYYLKHGVKPVRNRVADSDGPPDFWASFYTPEALGPYPARPFPTAHEVRPADPKVELQQVRRGRQVVIQHDCGACHSGGTNPAAERWLSGASLPTDAFPVGPCAIQPGTEPCFTQRPRNLTPHQTTGIGRYSDRQIFNALRYGLRPGSTPDVEITSGTPGEGNFPANPDYLGLGMPWPSWRYISDEDLWALIAYLRHGLKPVENDVPDSEGPPDNWASEYTLEKIGPYPAPPFPAANEVRR
jgi:mono/diheme cytochrome c family protein